MAVSNATMTQVADYINTQIYNNQTWTDLDAATQSRLVNNCVAVLLNILDKYYKIDTDIPFDVIAHQTVWMSRVDDSFLRAEMGASYVQIGGMAITLKDKDNSVAPYVLDKLNLPRDPKTGGYARRRVGGYTGSRSTGTDLTIFRNGV